MATHIGAFMPASYLSATAKWVGFATTTVAVGTAAIMRLRDRSCRMRRMRPLICGSPSCCLCSSRTSWIDIFSRSRQRLRCQRKSATAITENTATAATSTRTVSDFSTGRMAATSEPVSEATRARSGQTTVVMTAPTIASLMSPLRKLTRLSGENSRLKPATGETFENFGVIGSVVSSGGCWIDVARDRRDHQHQHRQAERGPDRRARARPSSW